MGHTFNSQAVDNSDLASFFLSVRSLSKAKGQSLGHFQEFSKHVNNSEHTLRPKYVYDPLDTQKYVGPFKMSYLALIVFDKCMEKRLFTLGELHFRLNKDNLASWVF